MFPRLTTNLPLQGTAAESWRNVHEVLPALSRCLNEKLRWLAVLQLIDAITDFFYFMPDHPPITLRACLPATCVDDLLRAARQAYRLPGFFLAQYIRSLWNTELQGVLMHRVKRALLRYLTLVEGKYRLEMGSLLSEIRYLTARLQVTEQEIRHTIQAFMHHHVPPRMIDRAQR